MSMGYRVGRVRLAPSRLGRGGRAAVDFMVWLWFGGDLSVGVFVLNETVFRV